jgi:hypothetical protein
MLTNTLISGAKFITSLPHRRLEVYSLRNMRIKGPRAPKHRLRVRYGLKIINRNLQKEG